MVLTELWKKFWRMSGFYKEETESVITIIEEEAPMGEPIKKALLVGLNKYARPGSDLRGCVNDVKNLHKVLIDVYKFKPDNIRVICDDRATQKNILERLNWLVSNNPVGSEVVFQYSGHGSQVRDRNGDELEDGLDEILCPHDLNWQNPLTDDILASILKKVSQGVFFTMVCDACHSGSMTRGFSNPGLEECDDKNTRGRFLPAPFDIEARSLGRSLPMRKIGANKKGPSVQRHVLLSGCEDRQTSADAYISRTYQGAMTYSFIAALAKDKNTTWKNVYTELMKIIKVGGFTQNPQLSGMDELLNRKVFGDIG